MSPAVSKGLSKANNAPARTYGANPKSAKGLGSGKGLPVTSTGPKANVGAQNAKNAARAGRKAANPKSLRSAVSQRLMTQAEAVEQATVKRAGVQAKNAAARSSIPANKAMVPSGSSKALVPSKATSTAGKGIAKVAGAKAVGKVAAKGVSKAIPAVSAFTTGYAIGTVLNETFDLSTKIGDYTDRVTGRAKQMEQSMTTTPRGGAGSGGRPKNGGGGGGKSGAPAAAAPAVTKPAASVAKPAVVKKAAPKDAPKTSTYGDDSRAQHESFRKELEAGGGRAAWSMSKQAEAGGAKVEISKPSSGTTLNAELDKFQASGGKKMKKDVQIGAIAGRKEGKWHLGKKAGKG